MDEDTEFPDWRAEQRRTDALELAVRLMESIWAGPGTGLDMITSIADQFERYIRTGSTIDVTEGTGRR